jgi:hypothetical protein
MPGASAPALAHTQALVEALEGHVALAAAPQELPATVRLVVEVIGGFRGAAGSTRTSRPIGALSHHAPMCQPDGRHSPSGFLYNEFEGQPRRQRA